jgi:hypothetical protein
MTWAIGACSMLGAYAVMVSDVQVTFSDGRTVDMLRKAYPVGRYIVGAFAGSVYIGFHLLQSIADHLRLPEDAPANSCWALDVVGPYWAPFARDVYAAAPKAEQELGAQFLLIGAHPTEDGIPSRAIPYLCQFSWPRFEAEVTRNGNSAISIGSGAHVQKYEEGIRELLAPKNGMFQAEVGNTGGWGSTFGYAVNRIVTWHQVEGISQHLHVHLAMRDHINVGNSDRTEYPKGEPPREVRMPRVAENYGEFLDMARSLEADAASAIC